MLPVDVDANGIVTVATENKIINNSYGPVSVKAIDVEPLNNWSLAEFNTDFALKKVNIKEFGFNINGNDVATNGDCGVAGFDVIPGGGSEITSVIDDDFVSITNQ